MTRTQRVIVILLICAVAGIIAGVTTGEREPHYRGKSLSDCLRFSDPSTGRLPKENSEAVKHIGTNAVPYLLKALKYRQPAWQTTLAKKFHVVYFTRLERRKSDTILGAVEAFRELGPQAKQAIPELASMMSSTNGSNAGLRQLSAYALGSIGTDAIPVLLDFLTNAPAHKTLSPANIAEAWAALGTNETNTIPTLLGCLEDQDSRVPEAAEEILVSFVASESGIDIIGPDLCRKLGSTNAQTRARATHLLAWFDNERSTLPYFRKALNDPDPRVRSAAAAFLGTDALPPKQPTTDQSTSNNVYHAAH